MNVLITGNSSGLGLGLTEAFLEQGAVVRGLSRRGCPLKTEMNATYDDVLRDEMVDLGDLNKIAQALESVLSDAHRLDLLILNAGVLGKIQPIHQTDVHDLEHLYRVNVWANKVILDWLIESAMPVDQVIAISSGAAINMNFGWGGYSLSKASINHLVHLYAQEMPETHLMAYAPGLVDTPMQDYLCGEVDSGDFPSVQKLKDARGTEHMPTPKMAAERLIEVLPMLKANYPSGGFVDIRHLS
ncbi:MAG TPA: SDR family NAD(P)-dependent oxidoreductase [Wenzhouxiangella sp.]